MYKSTKTYEHNLGLSCAFRQWRAKSHCSKIHGYALKFKFTFQAAYLDSNNWVVDFGGLKELKKRLEDMFDHRLIIAHDDPEKEALLALDKWGIADIAIVANTGCEAFAKMAFDMARITLISQQIFDAQVISCECSEHGGNSAIYEEEFRP